MKILSFRLRILGTIFILVIISSLVSITFFTSVLKKKFIAHTEESINQINVLRDQYYATSNHRDGNIVQSMFKDSEKDKHVLRTYLINSKSKVVYPENTKALTIDTTRIRELLTQHKNISISSFPDDSIPFYRVFIKLRNRHSCSACHNPEQKNLGIIVMDVSNQETQEIINFSRRFGLYYTLVILASIFALVAYLHYKFIRKSLRQFRTKISLINQGNLDARVDIPQVAELGSLGQNFNEMIDTFEKTRIELQLYHQKELQQSEKLATIGEMSARIAHEIRNPITGIARAIDVIIPDFKDSEHQPILEEIQKQASRVNQAIANLLKYSQSKDINLQTGNVNDVIQSLVFFLKNQKHDKTVIFEVNLSPKLPDFTFDSELIENVLMNLSLNSIQSIEDDAVITYSTSYCPSNKTVVISVKDNGSGVNSELGVEIFKPFFTTRTKGTGLGLAISKDIIERHNGKIWFKNNSNSGCTFFISLPV